MNSGIHRTPGTGIRKWIQEFIALKGVAGVDSVPIALL